MFHKTIGLIKAAYATGAKLSWRATVKDCRNCSRCYTCSCVCTIIGNTVPPGGFGGFLAFSMVYVREAENDHHHQNPLIFGYFFVAGAMFLRYNCFVVGFLIQSSARLDAMGGPVVARVGYWWPRVRDVDVVQAIATSFEFSEV